MKLSEEEALGRAAAYCSTSEHCLSEVTAKLDNWEVEPEEKARILQRLVAERYIDEERYCRAFVRDKYRFNKWGRNKIVQALRLKHIDSIAIERALESIDPDEYRETLRELLATKRKGVKARNAYELYAKLMRFAVGRGYEPDEIRRLLPESDEVDY